MSFERFKLFRLPSLRPLAAWLMAALAVSWLGLIAPALAAKKPPRPMAPTDIIEQFHTRLIDGLKKSDGKGFEARRTALAPAVTETFDSGFMAKVASGTTWDALSDNQRTALTNAFRDMTIANYASRFKAYTGQNFSILGAQPAPHDRTLVQTQLERKNGDPVRIDYLVGAGQKPNTFAIIDVRLNGSVSELAVRRSEFAPVLRDKGFDALLSMLKDKVAALASAPSDVDTTPR